MPVKHTTKGGWVMTTITVNGAELYHEVRGDGPPVLLIMGMTGDAGHFETLAELLADEFTVVSYDRRGNGRSPRPAGWATTSPEEQADDAAALLDALGLTPAAVYGSSAGGVFALCLLIRHPEAVRGAVLRAASGPAHRAAARSSDAARTERRRRGRRQGAAGLDRATDSHFRPAMPVMGRCADSRPARATNLGKPRGRAALVVIRA